MAVSLMVVVGSDELALLMGCGHMLWSRDPVTLSIANVYLSYNGSVV